MNNKMMNKLFAFIFFFAFTGAMMAQTGKVGYVNTDQIITLLPSFKTAEASLNAFAETVVTQEIKDKTKVLEAKDLKFGNEAQSMGEARREVAAAEINNLYKELQILHQENQTQQKVSTKQQELFAPIEEEAGKLINEVANANGFAIVFDASRAGIVFAQEGSDLLPLVKAKLGVE